MTNLEFFLLVSLFCNALSFALFWKYRGEIDDLYKCIKKLEGDVEDVDVYTYFPKYGCSSYKTKQNKVLDLLLAKQGLRLEKVYQVEDVKLIER